MNEFGPGFSPGTYDAVAEEAEAAAAGRANPVVPPAGDDAPSPILEEHDEDDDDAPLPGDEGEVAGAVPQPLTADSYLAILDDCCRAKLNRPFVLPGDTSTTLVSVVCAKKTVDCIKHGEMRRLARKRAGCGYYVPLRYRTQTFGDTRMPMLRAEDIDNLRRQEAGVRSHSGVEVETVDDDDESSQGTSGSSATGGSTFTLDEVVPATPIARSAHGGSSARATSQADNTPVTTNTAGSETVRGRLYQGPSPPPDLWWGFVQSPLGQRFICFGNAEATGLAGRADLTCVQNFHTRAAAKAWLNSPVEFSRGPSVHVPPRGGTQPGPAAHAGPPLQVPPGGGSRPVPIIQAGPTPSFSDGSAGPGAGPGMPAAPPGFSFGSGAPCFNMGTDQSTGNNDGIYGASLSNRSSLVPILGVPGMNPNDLEALVNTGLDVGAAPGAYDKHSSESGVGNELSTLLEQGFRQLSTVMDPNPNGGTQRTPNYQGASKDRMGKVKDGLLLRQVIADLLTDQSSSLRTVQSKAGEFMRSRGYTEGDIDLWTRHSIFISLNTESYLMLIDLYRQAEELLQTSDGSVWANGACSRFLLEAGRKIQMLRRESTYMAYFLKLYIYLRDSRQAQWFHPSMLRAMLMPVMGRNGSGLGGSTPGGASRGSGNNGGTRGSTGGTTGGSQTIRCAHCGSRTAHEGGTPSCILKNAGFTRTEARSVVTGIDSSRVAAVAQAAATALSDADAGADRAALISTARA